MPLDTNRFDEFVIESMIGEGGMGKVYRARQTALDRWVALKVLPRAKENPSFTERFYREARSAARLVHPNIIQIHTVGEMQGVPYFTMEYVEGEDLEHIIQAADMPLSNDCIIEIARSVAKALAVAFEQGVVHRDIKPANIMVSKTGLVKVMDFGLAKELDHSITQSGMVVGTPSYMSPEQGSGQTVDFRSDLYSLGCVLYACIKGEPPFLGEKVATIIYKHMFEPPPPLSDAEHPVDPDLEAVVMRMLAKKPEDRYNSCEALLEALAKMQFNSASAELLLSRHAQKSLKAKNLVAKKPLAQDPDAPVNLAPQTAVPIGPNTVVEVQHVEKKAPNRAELMPERIKQHMSTPTLYVAPPSLVAPLGKTLADKAKLAPNYKPLNTPTKRSPEVSDVPAVPAAPAPPAIPPPRVSVTPARANIAPSRANITPARIDVTPTRTSVTPNTETNSPQTPVKPLNKLGPPQKKEQSGILPLEGKLRKPPSNVRGPASILEEAEVVHRKGPLPVMRVQPRPESVSPVFSKLADGRWSYSKLVPRCSHAEGLAQTLAPIASLDVKNRGLGDCLLCSNWNKRLGCAVASNEDMLVKGRFSGMKLLTEQAAIWIGAGRFDNAIALLSEFIEDNPTNPYGFHELARIYDHPDYKGRDKRRGIILYLRYVELAREQDEGSMIEISQAEARANAMKSLPFTSGGVVAGEAIEFDCFYRGAVDCYVYCRVDMTQLIAICAGSVDPQTGVSEPDPNANVSAFRRAKSIFTRPKSEQEKQEAQSVVRKELARLAELDTAELKKEPQIACQLNLDKLSPMEVLTLPPDLSILKFNDKSGGNTFLFTGSNEFQGQRAAEFFRRRLGQATGLGTVKIETGRFNTKA